LLFVTFRTIIAKFTATKLEVEVREIEIKTILFYVSLVLYTLLRLSTCY